MTIRRFALILGIAFTIAGIVGFFPAFLSAPAVDDPSLVVNEGYGRLLGLFPVNYLHNIVHLLLGIWGVYAYRSMQHARIYAKSTAVIYTLVMLMGVIPGLDVFFGLMPLFSHDVWLHGIAAAASAYFGWIALPSGAFNSNFAQGDPNPV